MRANIGKKRAAYVKALESVARAAERIMAEAYPVTGRCGPKAWLAPLDRALDRLDETKGQDGRGQP